MCKLFSARRRAKSEPDPEYEVASDSNSCDSNSECDSECDFKPENNIETARREVAAQPNKLLDNALEKAAEPAAAAAAAAAAPAPERSRYLGYRTMYVCVVHVR